MTTKQKILQTARVLFNRNGISSTTVRMICKEMNISAGNFSYHYPDKDILVEELYYEMLKELDEATADMGNNTGSFVGYIEAHRIFFAIQTKYKFIYLNLFEIVINYPKLKLAYSKSVALNRQTAKKYLETYQAKGVIKRGIEMSYIENVLNAANLLRNTWITEVEINHTGSEKEKLKYYLKTICSLVEPYLTKKSKEEYRKYLQNL